MSMWPLDPREARLLAGLTPHEFDARVARATGPGELALTGEGAKVYLLQRGSGPNAAIGFGLAGYTSNDAIGALQRLHAMSPAR